MLYCLRLHIFIYFYQRYYSNVVEYAKSISNAQASGCFRWILEGSTSCPFWTSWIFGPEAPFAGRNPNILTQRVVIFPASPGFAIFHPIPLISHCFQCSAKSADHFIQLSHLHVQNSQSGLSMRCPYAN